MQYKGNTITHSIPSENMSGSVASGQVNGRREGGSAGVRATEPGCGCSCEGCKLAAVKQISAARFRTTSASASALRESSIFILVSFGDYPRQVTARPLVNGQFWNDVANAKA